MLGIQGEQTHTAPNGIPSPEAIQIGGHNTEVKFTFVRHSQKQSAHVHSNNLGLSSSSISEGGIERAKAWGEDNLTGRDVERGYATSAQRTSETLKAAFEGAGLDTIILQNSDTTNAFFELPVSTDSVEMNAEYERRLEVERQNIMLERFPNQKFDELNPDNQEIVAEDAEEPVADWYINYLNTDRREDPNTFTTREHARGIAFKINRLINLPDFMPDGNSVDLVSVGHKTSTEAFLKFAIVQNLSDGQQKTGFDHLGEIGGSMRILDGWDLIVRNDKDGNKTVSFQIHRGNGEIQNFDLNLKVINQLAKEYIEAANISAKRIDNTE